ncbi:MAG: FmdB family zinc ribbon protein [Anaerolineae bacterium]
MPIYEYDCQECGEHFDKLIRSTSANAAVTCPACHSTRCVKSLSCFCTSNSTRSTSQASMPGCANTG